LFQFIIESRLVVELEAAGILAVAKFREVILGQVLYGGDDLSGIEWDNRRWLLGGKFEKVYSGSRRVLA
jgi:hypothetical protein